MDFPFLTDILLRMLKGVPVALALAIPALTAGFLCAFGVAFGRMSGLRLIRWSVNGYLYIIRGTPLILQLFFIYYGFGQLRAFRDSLLWPLFLDPMFCSFLALMLSTSAYGGEIIRAALQSVPVGLREAADALGLTRWQRFRLVTFPIAVRQMLPAYGNEIVLLLKATAVTSTITVMEITGIARTIMSETYRPVEVFLSAGAIYLAMSIVIGFAVGFLERRWATA